MIRATAVCLLLVAAVPGTAAPPALNYLFPAGAQRGTTVEVTAAGTFERWPVRAQAEARGVEIKPGKSRGKLTVTVAADAEPGVTWLRLHDEQGGSGVRPFVVGTLPEVVEKDPNDDPLRAQELSGSSIVNGKLEKSGDVDVFAIALRKGQTLVASLLANQTLGSPMDAHLQVMSPDGFLLEESNDHHGLDPQAILTAPADGRYVVRIFAFPATPNSSISFAGGDTFVYRLTVTTGGFVDHAWPLAVPRSNPGAVELVGWNIADRARRVSVRDVAGGDSFTLWQPDLANTTAVRLESHAAGLEQEPNGPDKPQSIALPVTISGRIDAPGDVDAFEFAAKKGQAVVFRAEAFALDFPLDPLLRVTDAAGKVLVKVDDTARKPDPELSFKPPQDGTYRIEVRDLHDHGGPRYVYRLRAAGPERDFDLTVAADRFTLAAGKTADIPVTVVRRGGFTGEVVVTVQGLPEGVTAAPVATAKGIATLKLTSRSGPISSPFRITGHVKGEESRKRTARHAPAGLDAAITWLWLTVLPK